MVTVIRKLISILLGCLAVWTVVTEPLSGARSVFSVFFFFYCGISGCGCVKEEERDTERVTEQESELKTRDVEIFYCESLTLFALVSLFYPLSSMFAL